MSKKQNPSPSSHGPRTDPGTKLPQAIEELMGIPSMKQALHGQCIQAADCQSGYDVGAKKAEVRPNGGTIHSAGARCPLCPPPQAPSIKEEASGVEGNEGGEAWEPEDPESQPHEYAEAKNESPMGELDLQRQLAAAAAAGFEKGRFKGQTEVLQSIKDLQENIRQKATDLEKEVNYHEREAKKVHERLNLLKELLSMNDNIIDAFKG